MTTPFDNRLTSGAASAVAVASVTRSTDWKTLIEIGNVVFVLAPGKANAAPSVCIGIQKPGRKNPVCSRINSAAFVELCLFFRDDEKAGQLLDQIEQTERLSQASRQAKAGVVMDAPVAAPLTVDFTVGAMPWDDLVDPNAMPALNRNDVASMQAWLEKCGTFIAGMSAKGVHLQSDRALLRSYVKALIERSGLFNEDGSRK